MSTPETVPLTLYAFRVSWYSAKVRSYLQYKGIPFVAKKPSLLEYHYRIPKHCGGDAAVPVVLTPEDDWLQDSTVIIDRECFAALLLAMTSLISDSRGTFRGVRPRQRGSMRSLPRSMQ